MNDTFYMAWFWLHVIKGISIIFFPPPNPFLIHGSGWFAYDWLCILADFWTEAQSDQHHGIPPVACWPSSAILVFVEHILILVPILWENWSNFSSEFGEFSWPPYLSTHCHDGIGIMASGSYWCITDCSANEALRMCRGNRLEMLLSHTSRLPINSLHRKNANKIWRISEKSEDLEAKFLGKGYWSPRILQNKINYHKVMYHIAPANSQIPFGPKKYFYY